MNKERFIDLQKDISLKLTEEEKKAGWIFCNCEWDGMLINKVHPEAEFCHCLKERLECTVKN